MRNLEKEKNSENGFSSRNPPKSSASPRISSTGENNENESSQDQAIPKLLNQRSQATKHFMSPTISASSKAAVPRTKILAERNDNSTSSDVHIQKNFSSGFKRSPRDSGIGHSKRSHSGVVSLYNCASDSDDDGGTNFVADSSVKAYDPLTNYLSPRPQYLRFNPSRRREIFDRLEKEEEEDLSSSFDSQKVNDEVELAENVESSCFSPLKESAGKQEDEETIGKEDENTVGDSDDDEEEEEGIEEGRGWCFKGLLKVMLTLIACLLSTSYICSMNSPTPLPPEMVTWGFNGSYFMIQKQAFDVIDVTMDEYGVDIVDRVDMVDGRKSNGIEKDEKGTEAEMELEIFDDDEVAGIEEEEAKLEVHNEESNVDEDNREKFNETAETEGEFEFIAVGYEEPIVAETDGRETSGLEKGDEVSDQGFNEYNVDKIEAEVTVVSGDGEVGAESETIEHVCELPLVAAIVGAEESSTSREVENEAEDSNQSQDTEILLKSDAIQEQEEIIPNSSEEKLAHPFNEVDDETGNGNGGEVETTGRNNSTVIGVSVFILLASLAFIYNSKKARRMTKSAVNPSKFVIVEKLSQELPPPHVEKRIEFLPKPSQPLPTEESHEELNLNIHAPTVELIGEIVIGGSVRRKYQSSESEERRAAFPLKQDHLATPPRPLASSEPLTPQPVFPPTYSSTPGNATADGKTSKKEGRKRGEATSEITPVRRSNRLRNRAAPVS